MRTISAAGLAKLASKLGGAPVTIVAVQWTEGGSIYEYADVDINKADVVDLDHNIPGRIQEVSGMDNVITIQGTTASATTGDSHELSVTLDDIDGTIKNILDQNDIHKRPVWVYQWFDELDYADRFLLFKGQVSSPLLWRERDRTVSFDVINRIESVGVGFSIEEGNFQQVSEDLIGQAWPLCFGTVVHVPALKVQSPYSGTLQTGFGIRDFTLQPRIDQLEKMCCPLVFRGYSIRLTLGGQEADAVFAEDPSCYCKREGEIAAMTAELAAQIPFEYTTVKIIGGAVFPQGQQITLNVCGGAIIRGSFQGTNLNPSETFVISYRQHPEYATNPIPPIKNLVLCGIREEIVAPGGTQTAYNGGAYSTRDQLLFTPTTCGDTPTNSDGYGWDYYATFPVADFFWAEPGCDVFEQSNTEVTFIANLLPSTILRVAAYRTFVATGRKELVTVPANFYTVRQSDFNGYIVTEIVLNNLLSRRNEGYEDQLYVSLTSSEGPNTVDIMEWLIDKYTSFGVDTANFDTMRTKLDKYPTSFAILDRPEILTVLRELAFQSRCALILRNDVFTLKYLSEEPSVDFTITLSDIVPGSFELTHTETEDLVTELICVWRDDYAKEERVGPKKEIQRYNHKKYGMHRDEIDFWAYNIKSLVRKSATFWLIRMANTWRKIKFKTTLAKLQAEVLDCCEVTLPQFSAQPIKCLVDKATYDSDANTIDFELWTPVRSGETTPYVFAWPAQIEITDFWPTKDDRLNRIAGGGDSPNVDVEPPASHPLALPPGFTVNQTEFPCHALGVGEVGPSVGDCRPDHGDETPTDKDDKKPEKKVEGSGEGTTASNKSPSGTAAQWIQNQFVNDNLQQDQINRNTTTATSGQDQPYFDGNSGGSAGGSDGQALQDQLDELPSTDDYQDCSETPCTVTVRVGYINVTAIWNGNNFDNSPGAVGQVVGNQVITNFEKFTFNSLCSAQQFVQRMQAITDSYSAVVGGGNWPAPGHAAIIKQCWGEACEEPDEPNMLAYDNEIGNGKGTAATQGLMDNTRTFKDEDGNNFTPSNYGPC